MARPWLGRCLLAATVAAAVLSGSSWRVHAAGLQDGIPDKQTLAYVSHCLGGAPPRPLDLYARGGWFITEDLREQMREHAGNLEGIAMVWRSRSHRAVYQWNHDLEFNRDVVACMDSHGKVTRSESRYMPARAAARQSWIYLHTLMTNPHNPGTPRGTGLGSGRFTDAQGHPMGRPHLSTEDEDFIAGERVFHQWKDFDFANLVDTHQQ